MLPAAHRMRSAADFSETTRHGRKAARGCVVVYAQVPPDAAGSVGVSPAPARVGLIVGKAVGGSVQRHRAARRIRGVLAGHLDTLEPGTRVVVRALKGADTDADLSADLAAALSAATGARR